jgi:hypothetical protein
MRLKLYALALASILTMGGLAATSGPASAGDGFARYLQQQKRDRDRAIAREKARLRQQALLRSRSSTPKSAGARMASPVSRSARPGATSLPSAR